MDIISVCKARKTIENIIRSFLEKKGYNEVETPIFSKTAIPESTIELYSCNKVIDGKFINSYYLLPSPELYMKRIISECNASIFQFAKSFRNSEQDGVIHSPEFTMLEYYKVGEDEKYSLNITEQLFNNLAAQSEKFYEITPDFSKKIKVVSMREIVKDITNLDLDKLQNKDDLQKAIFDYGINIYSPDEEWEDSFLRLFVSVIEPEIQNYNTPIAITDYPKQINCLCKNKENSFYKKRWELYYKGVELANCYAEETDKKTIENYFEEESKKKLNIDKTFKPDTDLIKYNLPLSSGVALGFDRLVMCLLKKNSIKDIIPYANLL